MYTIGQFSIMTRIPKKTLRYYDEINLLKPARTDHENNYRYYDDISLMTAQQILIYRSCEMPLERIREILNRTDDEKNLKGILLSQMKLLRQKADEIRQSQSVLQGVIDSLDKNSGEEVRNFFRKKRNILSIRREGGHSTIGEIISELFETAARNGLEVSGPHTIIWHTDKDFTEDRMDMEIYIPVEAEEQCSLENFSSVPGRRYCEIVHHGPLTTLSSSYSELYSYVKQNNLTISGPFEETYLSERGFIDPRNMKIIISVPVEEGSCE